jgi:hypothetical protein
MGLRIGTQMRVRHRGPGTTEVDGGDSQTDVVKLECPSPEQPFQASQIIPSPAEPDASAGSRAGHPPWKIRFHHVPRWLVGGALGVTSVLAFALVAQERWLREVPEDQAPQVELADEEALPQQVEGFESTGTSEREARELLETYARARTVAQVLPLVRDHQALETRIARDWQPWGATTSWKGVWAASWELCSEDGRSFGVLVGRRPDFSTYRAYFVRENGALRLDWEATEGQSAASFDLLVRGSGTGGAVRTLVKPDFYYTPTFPENRYQCFKLTSPDRQQVIWAYAEHDGAAASRIMGYFETATFLDADGDELQKALRHWRWRNLPTRTGEQGNPELPMTLRLAPPPKGAQKNQWLIPEMLHNEWVSR